MPFRYFRRRLRPSYLPGCLAAPTTTLQIAIRQTVVTTPAYTDEKGTLFLSLLPLWAESTSSTARISSEAERAGVSAAQ
jgi:hypothetical protein